jgi:hypothetical protein
VLDGIACDGAGRGGSACAPAGGVGAGVVADCGAALFSFAGGVVAGETEGETDGALAFVFVLAAGAFVLAAGASLVAGGATGVTGVGLTLRALSHQTSAPSANRITNADSSIRARVFRAMPLSISRQAGKAKGEAQEAKVEDRSRARSVAAYALVFFL